LRIGTFVFRLVAPRPTFALDLRLDMSWFSSGRWIIDDCEALVDRSVSCHDLGGWTDAIWTEVH
jgi:hypothetical protein